MCKNQNKENQGKNKIDLPQNNFKFSYMVLFPKKERKKSRRGSETGRATDMANHFFFLLFLHYF